MSLTMMHEAGKKYQKIPLKMLGVTTCFFLFLVVVWGLSVSRGCLVSMITHPLCLN